MSESASVRTRYIDTGGPRLFVTDIGTVDASRTLVVIHGYAEHAGRYLRRMQPLVEAGWRVLLTDMRGHGRSEGQRGHVLRWSEYHDDVDRIMALVTTDAAHTAILGHSNGGLIVASWLVKNADRVKTGVLTSPLLAIAITPPAWKAKAGNVLSRWLSKVSLPTEIRPEWVSRDPATVADYAADPLNHHIVDSRWFTEATGAMESTLRDASQITLPMLVMQGGDDRLVSAAASARFARALPRATYEEIEGAYHELLFDLGAAEHSARILRWLHEQIPA